MKHSFTFTIESVKKLVPHPGKRIVIYATDGYDDVKLSLPQEFAKDLPVGSKMMVFVETEKA